MIADVVDGDDVGVVERRDGTGLLLEAAEAVGIVREARREHFDRNVAAEARVAGAVDLAHSTFANLGKDLVRPEHLTSHYQVLSMARVDPPKLAATSGASEGGPPAPSGATIS